MLRLRRALDTKGITVKGCAAMIGVSEKAFQNKLAERNEFTYKEARALKEIFQEYDIDYLLSSDCESA